MRSLTLCVMALGLVVSACAQAGRADLASEEKVIRDMDGRWLKAVQSRDASAEAAMFADDGVAYREHTEPIVGREAYQAYLAKFYAENPKVATSWTTESVRVVESGDLAVQTGAYRTAALGANGDGEDRGRYVTVWKKVAGAWKVAHDIGVTTLPAAAAVAVAGDPILGTWELNVAKSRYAPGPAPKSETRTYVASGGEIKATSKVVDSTGAPITAAWTINYDGADRPQTGNPDAELLSVTRVDALTAAFTQKRGGKVVFTGTRVISQDGKVMTITTKGTNAKGQSVDDAIVFEKR